MHRLVVYRTIERCDLSDEGFGLYAAAVEHMEICRNKTWDTQGGRNVVSPLLQRLGGPDLWKQIARSGGLLGGKATAAIPGQMGKMGRTGGSATKETTEGRKGNCGRGTNETTQGRKSNGGLIGGHLSGGSITGKIRMSLLGKTGAGGRKGGPIAGRIAVDSGQLSRARNLFHNLIKSGQIRIDNRAANHVRWHVSRDVVKEGCELCELKDRS